MFSEHWLILAAADLGERKGTSFEGYRAGIFGMATDDEALRNTSKASNPKEMGKLFKLSSLRK